MCGAQPRSHRAPDDDGNDRAMNSEDGVRQVRNRDRRVRPPSPSRTTSADPTPARRARLITAVALVAAVGATAGLWAAFSGVHAGPVALEPLPTSTVSPAGPAPLPGSCTDSAGVRPIGCATYTAIAAAGILGGTRSWTGAAPPTLTLRTTNDSVTAFIRTACNGLSGPATISPTEITLISGGAMTSAACGGGRGAQDTWIAELFAHPVHYAMDNDVLTLTSGSRTLQLTSAGRGPAGSRSEG